MDKQWTNSGEIVDEVWIWYGLDMALAGIWEGGAGVIIGDNCNENRTGRIAKSKGEFKSVIYI